MKTESELTERAREFVEEKINGHMVRFPDDVPGWLASFAAAIQKETREEDALLAETIGNRKEGRNL